MKIQDNFKEIIISYYAFLWLNLKNLDSWHLTLCNRDRLLGPPDCSPCLPLNCLRQFIWHVYFLWPVIVARCTCLRCLRSWLAGCVNARGRGNDGIAGAGSSLMHWQNLDVIRRIFHHCLTCHLAHYLHLVIECSNFSNLIDYSCPAL